MHDVLYMSSVEINLGLTPENWLEQVVNTASNSPQHLMVSTTASLIKYMAFTVWNHTSDILAWSWNTWEKAAVNSLKVDRLRDKLQWETLTSLNRQRRNLDPHAQHLIIWSWKSSSNTLRLKFSAKKKQKKQLKIDSTNDLLIIFVKKKKQHKHSLTDTGIIINNRADHDQ